MTSREAIVAALGAVPGLTASPTRPATVAAGAAWPEWRSTRWRNQVRGGVRDASWYVLVAMPAGAWDATVAEADPQVEVIGQALADAQLGVDLVEPFYLPMSEGGEPIPVLRFTVGDR